MFSKRFAGVVLAVSIVLLPAACGSGPKVTAGDKSDQVKKVEQPSSDDLLNYLKGYASGDPDKMAASQKLAAPGSVAEAYLIHQAAVANATNDGGEATAVNKVTKIKNGYKLCDIAGIADSADPADACADFTDFKSEGVRISSFSISGNSLSDRITLGDGKSIKIGNLAKAKFVSAYRTSGDALFVVFEIKSGPNDIAINTSSFKYRAPDGRQTVAAFQFGPTDLTSDSKATIVAVFNKAKVGGEVTMDISDSNYNTQIYPKVKIG